MSQLESVTDPGLKTIFDKFADVEILEKYRLPFLQRRIDRRMRSKGIRSYADYAKVLVTDPTEYQALISEISITVTEFFRDMNLFETLRSKIMPSILFQDNIGGSGQQEARVWSAGCATGEEPYSTAIVAKELMSKPGINTKTKELFVIATDLNPNSIKIANLGNYEESSLKKISAELKVKYFSEVICCRRHQQQSCTSCSSSGKSKFYHLDKKIRDMVTFEVGDIAKISPKAEDFDLILCRNVMIYFEKESREKLLRKFYDALKPKGYFVIGQSEVIMGSLFSLFRPVFSKERIYQKI